MKTFNYIILAFLLVFTACDDFLSEPPSKTDSIEPKTTEDLDYLLNKYSTFDTENNADAVFGSDDFGLLTRLFDSGSNIYSVKTAQYATWDVEYLPVQEDRPYFPEEWQKIFKANFVLQQLSEVSGSESEKLALKAEAHFLRAYSYYQLVNTYCLPYSTENMNELGLPIKPTTSFEESIKRASLRETWDFILNDISEGLKLNRELTLTDTGYRTWRASTPAVNALAARIYLTMGDYAKAQSYAQATLNEHNELVDYNTEMYYSEPRIIDGPDGEPVTLYFPYTIDGQGQASARMPWKELYYFRFLTNGSWNTYPSDELMALYDQTNDLRYKYHMVEDYSYDRGASVSHPAYFFFWDKMPSGPTVGEMLLVKAECQARQGQWSEAMTTVNTLRAVRMDNTADESVINLSAANQDEAIAKILEERRRELPFTQRLFDVRRFNNNNYAADDVVMTREFYPVSSVIEVSQGVQTQVLEKKSRRFARPLPDAEVFVSQGELEQNTY